LAIVNFTMIPRVIRAIKRRGLVSAIHYVYDDFLFEYRYGMKTAIEIARDDLTTDSQNKYYSASYKPVRSRMFRDAMMKLPAELTDGVFLDIGCGKGRALILAAELGYQKVYGIEFSPQLVEICKANIEKFRQKRKTDTEFDVTCVDAAHYEISEHINVIFLFNPFGEPVMGQVVENVVASLLAHPRVVYVVYINPLYAAWKECVYAYLIDEKAEHWQIFKLVVT
jgi:SAM-dependent methyltransferase